MSRLASEIDRLRDELEQRTNSMGNEMMRWKSQADAAANAVSLAKDEVMERQRRLTSPRRRWTTWLRSSTSAARRAWSSAAPSTSTSSVIAPTTNPGAAATSSRAFAGAARAALAASALGWRVQAPSRQGCLRHARGEDAPSRIHGWRKHVHPGARPQPPQRWRRGLRCEEGQALTCRTLAGVEREEEKETDGRMDG